MVKLSNHSARAYESPVLQTLLLEKDVPLCAGSQVGASYQQVEELESFEW